MIANLSKAVRLSLFFLLLFLCVDFMSCGKSYYDILGVKKDANAKQIKKAYLTLSKKYHPDKNPGDEEAQKKFVEVATAYEVLIDSDKRRIYDTQGEDGLKSQGQQAHQDPFNLFSQFGFGNFFGGGQHQGQGEERRGDDTVLDLPVSLNDLYKGRIFEVEIKNQVLCPHCRGSGARSENDIVKCKACDGKGVRVQIHQIAPGFVQQMQSTCEVCGGKGKIIKQKCEVCDGKKIVAGSRKIDVLVESGMKDGQQIEFENAGDEHPDHAAGHIIFKILTLPHAEFTRKGDDLHYTMHITLLESLVGFQRSIRHLDDHSVRIGSSGVTKPGEVKRIVGEGMPQHEATSIKGDLFVKFVIEFPEALSSEQRAGFASILK